MAKNAPKLSTMVDEKFEIYFSQWLKMHTSYRYRRNKATKNQDFSRQSLQNPDFSRLFHTTLKIISFPAFSRHNQP
jgi:hypothetical protein